MTSTVLLGREALLGEALDALAAFRDAQADRPSVRDTVPRG